MAVNERLPSSSRAQLIDAAALDAVAPIVSLHHGMATGELLDIDRRAIARARSRGVAAARDLPLLLPELAEGRSKQLAAYASRRADWAEKTVVAMSDTLLDLHRGARNAPRLLRGLSLEFLPLPILPDLDFSIDDIWKYNVPWLVGPYTIVVGLRKVHITWAGFELLNVVVLQLPSVEPDFKPDRIVLPKTTSVEKSGMKISVFDPPTPITGKEIIPPTQPPLPRRFSGYGKVIWTADVPAGCSIAYRQVRYTTVNYLLPGAPGWTTPATATGAPAADPPGGGPSIDVGVPGTVFHDFPGGLDTFPQGTRACFRYRFRCWVVLLCPRDAPKPLGYVEWGYTQVLDYGPNGPVDVAIPPAPAAPATAPPGGWPATAPSTVPVTWTDAAAAPAGATADYQKLFP